MKNIILLVEDELKTGQLLKDALEEEDIDAVWAQDGNEALKAFEKGKFDLIVLDLKLPGMSGEDILERIREIDQYVEVVVYTNYGEPAVMQKLMNLGVDGYVKKGPSADLYEMVEKIKSKIDPFSEDERIAIINNLPDSTTIDRNKGN